MPDDTPPTPPAEAGTPTRPVAAPPSFTFKAFLSYSHAADIQIAAWLQRGLEWFARPFYRGRAFRVFRDQTNLSANLDLWGTILEALTQSEFYIYLASPRAAQSPWVRDELDYWFTRRGPDKVMLVLAGGTLEWDRQTGDFDWARTDAIPRAMQGRFVREPLWVDMTWARAAGAVDPRDPRLEDAIATLAAPLHGQPKDQLFGEHLHLQRQARRQRTWAMVIMALLSVVATTFGVISVIYRNRAEERARVALSRQLSALSTTQRTAKLDRSLLLAVEAARAYDTFEARDSLFRALQDRPGIRQFLHVDAGDVTRVAFSPDGSWVAAGVGYGGGRGGVVLWDASTRYPVERPQLPVPEGDVSGVAFSPDSHILAAGFDCGSSGGLILWDMATRTRLTEKPLPVSEDSVRGVAFSHDGRTVAAGYGLSFVRGGVVLWDVPTRERLVAKPLVVSEGFVHSVAFSPDGKSLAAGFKVVGNGASGVVLWDLATRLRVVEKPLAVPEGFVESVAFSPDGKSLAAGFSSLKDEGGVVLWDRTTLERTTMQPLEVREGDVGSVAFSPDGRTLAAGYDVGEASGGGVVLWDVKKHSRLTARPLAVGEGGVGSVDFSPDGTTLAAGFGVARGGGAGGVTLWDLPPHSQIVSGPLPVKEGYVSGVAFRPDGTTLAAGYSAGDAGGVVEWDPAARLRLAETPLTVPEGAVECVAYSPDGKTLAAGYERIRAGTSRGGVVLFDTTARTRRPPGPFETPEGCVWDVAFRPDGTTLAAGYGNGGEGGVVLWDLVTRTRRAGGHLAVPQGCVYGVAFSPDGPDPRGGLRALPRAGRPRRGPLGPAPARRHGPGALQVPEGDVTDLAFSPDGQTLAAAYDVGRVVGGVAFWDVRSRKAAGPALLPTPEGAVCCLAFTRDGRTLAAGLAGEGVGVGGVVLCDAQARRRLVEPPLEVSGGYVWGVDFRPDGKTLAAGFRNGGTTSGVVLCDVDILSWQGRAGRVSNRNFSPGERRIFFPDETSYHRTFPDLYVPPEAGTDRAAYRKPGIGRVVMP